MPQLVFATRTQDHFGGRPYSAERLVNYFFRPGDGLSPGTLWGASGLTEIADLGSGPVRAIVEHAGMMAVASEGHLWTVTTGGAMTDLGAVADGETRLASNGDEIAMVVGGSYRLWNGTSLLSPTTGALTSVDGVVFQDGYFVLSGATATREDVISITGLYDGATISALDVATAEFGPDDLIGMISDHGELWLFGARSIEIWYNSGSADFPFRRNAGGIIEHGCADAATIQKEDNAVFWVGSEGVVYRASSVSPQVISTRAVEERIRAGTVNGGIVYMDRGHKFYAVRMAGEPALCYDMTTGLWCERSSSALDGAWVARCSVRIGQDWYVGGSDGKIYRIDQDAYTDGSRVLKAVAQAAPVDKGERYFPVRRLTARMQTGTTDIGREPKVSLQVSRDGRVWGNEKFRDMGSLGNFTRDISWNGLGAYTQFHARLSVSDPVPRDIYGVTYD